jgi:hypothetical protein
LAFGRPRFWRIGTKEKLELAFVGIDVSKNAHVVVIAEDGRDCEVRDFGIIPATPAAVQELLKKLATRFQHLHICYEVGPTGYGHYRQMISLGFDCCVVAPCSDDLVAAVTGQSPAMVQHYTKKPRQKIKAIQAQQKRTEQKQKV